MVQQGDTARKLPSVRTTVFSRHSSTWRGQANTEHLAQAETTLCAERPEVYKRRHAVQSLHSFLVAQAGERHAVQARAQPRTAAPARACARWCGLCLTPRRKRTLQPPPCRTLTPATALGVCRHDQQPCVCMCPCKFSGFFCFRSFQPNQKGLAGALTGPRPSPYTRMC